MGIALSSVLARPYVDIRNYAEADLTVHAHIPCQGEYKAYFIYPFAPRSDEQRRLLLRYLNSLFFGGGAERVAEQRSIERAQVACSAAFYFLFDIDYVFLQPAARNCAQAAFGQPDNAEYVVDGQVVIAVDAAYFVAARTDVQPAVERIRGAALPGGAGGDGKHASAFAFGEIHRHIV